MNPYPWLTSYPEGIDWDYPIEVKPLYTILDDAAARFPDRPALDFLGKHFSYKQLEKRVSRAAEGFKQLGVTKGTKVGLFLPNCPQSVISFFAILKAGGTVVNFSPLYALEELKHQLKDSETEIMVTLNLSALYPKVKELLGCGKLHTVVVGTMEESLPFPKSILFPILKYKDVVSVKADKQHVSFQSLLEHDRITDIPPIDPEEDIAVLQYTGGTTGVPKGAVLTHQNLYANTMQCGLWFSQVEDGRERMLGVLPFFHVFAMTAVMNFSVLKGLEIVMHPRFELKHVLKDIQQKKPTLMPGVPTMFAAINNHPKLKQFNLSSLKACISGGAALPVEVKETFERHTGCTLVEGYGLTETSPVVCANPLAGKNKPGSIGLPLPQTIVQIEDMEAPGKFLGTGERGELCVKGPQVMLGYWKNPEATKDVIQDGLLRTGDVAIIDEDGYVSIVDRLKELIIAGGYNIYPRNVEEAIYQHDAVLEAAVVGIPDPYRGQTVKAFVALKPGKMLEAADLKAFLKDKLGRHEIPTHIEFRDALPKTMIGKISKKDLVE